MMNDSCSKVWSVNYESEGRLPTVGVLGLVLWVV